MQTDDMPENLAEAALLLEAEQEQEAASQITAEELDRKVEEIRRLRDDYDEKKRISNEAHALFEQKLQEMLPILEALGRNNYALGGFGTVSRVTESKYKLPEDRQLRNSVYAYINNTYGRETLDGYLTIHHDKINSFVRGEVEQGRTVPGIPAPSTETYTKFTKARGT